MRICPMCGHGEQFHTGARGSIGCVQTVHINGRVCFCVWSVSEISEYYLQKEKKAA